MKQNAKTVICPGIHFINLHTVFIRTRFKSSKSNSEMVLMYCYTCIQNTYYYHYYYSVLFFFLYGYFDYYQSIYCYNSVYLQWAARQAFIGVVSTHPSITLLINPSCWWGMSYLFLFFRFYCHDRPWPGVNSLNLNIVCVLLFLRKIFCFYVVLFYTFNQ